MEDYEVILLETELFTLYLRWSVYRGCWTMPKEHIVWKEEVKSTKEK